MASCPAMTSRTARKRRTAFSLFPIMGEHRGSGQQKFSGARREINGFAANARLLRVKKYYNKAVASQIVSSSRAGDRKGGMRPHRKHARPSTRDDHEIGEARRDTDRLKKEKGDTRRRHPPRKR